MKRFKNVLTWVPIVAVFVYATWYHNGYSLIAMWIAILGLYLSNAFERIDKLEKRVEALESEREASASSTTL
jgi:hypothetical protein